MKNQDFRNRNILIYCNGNTTVQQVNGSAEILINKQQYLSKTLKYWCKLPPCSSTAPHGCTYSTQCSEIRKCETVAVTNQMEREMHTSTKHSEAASAGLAGLRCVTLASDPPARSPCSLRHTLLHNTTRPFLIPPPTHALLKVSLQLQNGG